MKIFSKHRKKIDPYRRFGSKEFKEKLNTAKNYKRLGTAVGKEFNFFTKTGLSRAGTYSALVFLGAIFYFLIISQYFLVTNVTVSGNKQVSTDSITSQITNLADKRFLLVPQNSFFTLNSGRLNSLFAKNLPEIREIKSHRSWPNKISIEVTERTPALVLSDASRNYLIDDQGFVMKEVAEATQFTIVDQSDEDIRIGEVIDGKMIPFVISMQKQWPSKIPVPVTVAKIPAKAASEVEFVSSEGWSAFFSTDRPVTNQLSNLSVLLNNLTHNGQKAKLVYIDLRLAKWAYYCLKSTPCQQTETSELPETAGATEQNLVGPKPQ